MGGKPRKRPIKRTTEEYQEIIKKLGTCVLWSLKFMEPRGGGEGLVSTPETGEMQVWTEKFMDALDSMGYEIDREVYYNRKDEKRTR
jgi:hypothetical protein